MFTWYTLLVITIIIYGVVCKYKNISVCIYVYILLTNHCLYKNKTLNMMWKQLTKHFRNGKTNIIYCFLFFYKLTWIKMLTDLKNYLVFYFCFITLLNLYQSTCLALIWSSLYQLSWIRKWIHLICIRSETIFYWYLLRQTKYITGIRL